MLKLDYYGEIKTQRRGQLTRIKIFSTKILYRGFRKIRGDNGGDDLESEQKEFRSSLSKVFFADYFYEIYTIIPVPYTHMCS